jgi:hypothetical protein
MLIKSFQLDLLHNYISRCNSTQDSSYINGIAQWFRHYTETRKVAGSKPVEVSFFFNLPNPSGVISP